MQQPTAENVHTTWNCAWSKGAASIDSSCHGKRPMDVRGWVGKFLGCFHRGKMTLFTIILENFFCHLRQSIFFFYNALWPLFFRPLPSPLLSAIFFKQKYIYSYFISLLFRRDRLFIYIYWIGTSRAEKRYDTGYLLNIFERFNFIKAATKTIYR